MDIRKSEVFNNHPDVAPALRWQARYKWVFATLLTITAILTTAVLNSGVLTTNAVLEISASLIFLEIILFTTWRRKSRETMERLWRRFSNLAQYLQIDVEVLSQLSLEEAKMLAREKATERAEQILLWHKGTRNILITNTNDEVLDHLWDEIKTQREAMDDELLNIIDFYVEFNLFPDASYVRAEALERAELKILEAKNGSGDDLDTSSIFR